jgi:hypothetical protein
MQSVAFSYHYAECCYAEYCYAECHYAEYRNAESCGTQLHTHFSFFYVSYTIFIALKSVMKYDEKE